MKHFRKLLLILSLFSIPAYSKTFELPLLSCDFLFFDSSEDEMDTNEKTRLSKDDFNQLYFNIIVRELEAMQVPWVRKQGEQGESISGILRDILNRFKYDKYFYYKIYQAPESGEEEEIQGGYHSEDQH